MRIISNAMLIVSGVYLAIGVMYCAFGGLNALELFGNRGREVETSNPLAPTIW
jgi:hypothetical protein